MEGASPAAALAAERAFVGGDVVDTMTHDAEALLIAVEWWSVWKQHVEGGDAAAPVLPPIDNASIIGACRRLVRAALPRRCVCWLYSLTHHATRSRLQSQIRACPSLLTVKAVLRCALVSARSTTSS